MRRSRKGLVFEALSSFLLAHFLNHLKARGRRSGLLALPVTLFQTNAHLGRRGTGRQEG
jgi:hypothetical protein